MSTLYSSVESKIYKIQKWLGVNESEDGDTGLKSGEASVMRNFRVTDGGALQIRPGTANIAGLVSSYSVGTGEEAVITEESNNSTYTADTYASLSLDSSGNITPNGGATELNAGSWSRCRGRYIVTGKLTGWKFTRCEEKTAQAGAGQVHIDGGIVTYLETGTGKPQRGIKTMLVLGSYDGGVRAVYGSTGAKLRGSEISLADEGRTFPKGGFYKGADGNIYYDADKQGFWAHSDGYSYCWAYLCRPGEADTWTWYGEPVAQEVSGTQDNTVRGIWSGLVQGEEIIAAACAGHLWKLAESGGVWTKTEIGAVDTSGPVEMFGFSNRLYVLDGKEYRVWDGETFTAVQGYVPCVAIGCAPTGGGTDYEQVNKLTGKRWQKFSADGEAIEYTLLEKDLASIDRVEIDGSEVTDYTADLEGGRVTFTTAPALGINNVHIYYTVSDSARADVLKMRYAEFYNGQTDSRVFLYGDGSSKTFYSGVDINGEETAEYFPDLNEIRIGDANAPITALIRHYNRLLAFKLDSAYSIYYGQLTSSAGTLVAGFYVSTVNRAVGNEAYGQAVLVENRPRTLDGRSIYEWRSTSTSGNITGDQRNAKRISQRVAQTIKSFSLKDTVCFYDKFSHEYYAVYNGTALVHNAESDAWYVYTDFPAVCFVNYRDELYFGTADGWLRRVSRDYRSDNGAPIDALWESGSLSFDKDYIRKYSLMLWVGMKPEENAEITAGVETEREEKRTAVITPGAAGTKPKMTRLKIKASKFTYYRLSFQSCSAETTATIVSTDIDARFTSVVR